MAKHPDGIVTTRRRFELRTWQKAAGLSMAGFGLSLLLATGAMAAPPDPASGATPPAPSALPAPSTQPGDMPMPPAGGPAGGGTVTAVSGNTITVQGGGPASNGATRTITVNGDTLYFTGGPGQSAKASLADVQVGGRIHAEGTTDSSGNFTAVLVRVEAPSAGGEVSAVSGNTITVKAGGPASNGATQTITVSGSTTYTIGGPDSTTAGSLADVQVGTRIRATGTLNGDGSLSAAAVRIDQPPSTTGTPPTPPVGGPRGHGDVTAVSGNTITVQDNGPAGAGATQSITVTASTVYLVGGPGSVTKGSLANVTIGTHVHAEGATDSNGNFMAVLIRVEQR
jgi:hypothetical protein